MKCVKYQFCTEYTNIGPTFVADSDSSAHEPFRHFDAIFATPLVSYWQNVNKYTWSADEIMSTMFNIISGSSINDSGLYAQDCLGIL